MNHVPLYHGSAHQNTHVTPSVVLPVRTDSIVLHHSNVDRPGRETLSARNWSSPAVPLNAKVASLVLNSTAWLTLVIATTLIVILVTLVARYLNTTNV